MSYCIQVSDHKGRYHNEVLQSVSSVRNFLGFLTNNYRLEVLDPQMLLVVDKTDGKEWTYRAINFAYPMIGIDAGPEKQAVFRPDRFDGFLPEDHPEAYRDDPVFHRLVDCGFTIREGLEHLLRYAHQLRTTMQLMEEQRIHPPRYIAPANTFWVSANNPPKVEDNDPCWPQLTSRKVLGLVGGEPMVVIYWEARDPDDAQQSGWKTVCSEGWDVSGKVTDWQALCLPKKG